MGQNLIYIDSEMEGKVALRSPKMQLSDVTRERDKEVDQLSTKVINLEGQLNRERTTTSMLQVICVRERTTVYPSVRETYNDY